MRRVAIAARARTSVRSFAKRIIVNSCVGRWGSVTGWARLLTSTCDGWSVAVVGFEVEGVEKVLDAVGAVRVDFDAVSVDWVAVERGVRVAVRVQNRESFVCRHGRLLGAGGV